MDGVGMNPPYRSVSRDGPAFRPDVQGINDLGWHGGRTKGRRRSHITSATQKTVGMSVKLPWGQSIGNAKQQQQRSFVQMASGAPMHPSGFHIRRNARWLASFEYYQFGNAYLDAALTGDERDAVLIAMVSIQSTNHWLARDISQNQSSPYGN
jgi:hypothetical protein